MAEPLAPLVTVSHATELDACQLQPVAAATDTLPVPAVLGAGALVGVTVYVHVRPAWLTLKGCPAMVRLADRDDVDVFAATLKTTEPLPVPDAPFVTLSHCALLVAVH